MMQFRLEKRREPSRVMLYATPVAAVVLTMIVGAIIFSAIGYDGVGAVREIFLTPLTNSFKWQDLGVKAAPLIIIGVGLAMLFAFANPVKGERSCHKLSLEHSRSESIASSCVSPFVWPVSVSLSGRIRLLPPPRPCPPN